MLLSSLISSCEQNKFKMLLNLFCGQVCAKLNDPKVRLSEIEISLFSPVKPMLAETWSPSKLRVILKGNALLAEVKYDGERCQIHKQGNQFKYFSRYGNDNTEVQ